MLTATDAAAFLRHVPPALLLGAVTAHADGRLVCTSRNAGPFGWAELLEGAAQAAGLLAGVLGGPGAGALVAEYRDLEVRVACHAGPVSFAAALDRRVLRFWRCRTRVAGADGRVLLTARVTLAPQP
ncbi:MAG: hypothetical protein KIT14_17815 [bacterium]|nr:hypothetical protein [bacterium]